MNTVGVDTSLTRFSPASAPSSKSRSTIAQLYGVDTHARLQQRSRRLENSGMAASSSGVRPASTQDAAACLAIYRPYVQNTAISWEIDVPTPTVGEMAARIERHRAERPNSWWTIEEPIDLACAVERAANQAEAIIVDCLTIWLSNLFFQHRDGAPQQVENCVRKQLEKIAAVARSCHLILVSNELGCGTVPEPALTRAFRDAQGLLNQWAAEAADDVVLTVAGLPMYLKTHTA